jgi:hypothetical protein
MQGTVGMALRCEVTPHEHIVGRRGRADHVVVPSGAARLADGVAEPDTAANAHGAGGGDSGAPTSRAWSPVPSR